MFYNIRYVLDQILQMCRKCGEIEEALYHLLCECDSIATLRQSVLGKPFSNPKDVRDRDIKHILKTASQTKIF